MENALGEDIPVGIYHTHDKIKHFKLRVKVRKIANACFTEKETLAFGDSNELEMVNLLKSSTVSTERTFSWQEKVEKNKPEDDSMIDANSPKKDVTICLFSYTDPDILSSNWKDKKAYTYPSSQPSHLEDLVSKWKPRSRLLFPEMETWQKPLFSCTKRIVKDISNQKEAFEVGQSMVIMAALYFEDSTSVEELDLCFLQINDHGTLTVIPDFSRRKSYTFIDSRSETFEYEIENASDTLKDSAMQREKQLIKKVALYKRKIKEKNTGEMIMLAPQTASFVINFEIVSASNFQAPDIFVHYLVVIPKGCSSEATLEGVSETCRSKWKDHSHMAYYGYTFTIDVLNEIKRNIEPLRIIIEVTSVDYWGNFRNEGYGYTDVMLIPGSSVHEIHTWKIEPRTLRDKLQNHFIGGMPHLEDLTYIVIPPESKDSQLSKYGVRTLTSGTVKLKYFVIQQCNPESIQ